MHKLRGIFLITALFVLLLSGCTDKSGASDTSVSPEQTASGGVFEPAENINLKNISVTMDGDATVVTLSLLSGSRENGYQESKLTHLPEYEIEKLKQPHRVKITLHNISFWDYIPSDDWALNDFVPGIFKEVPADNDSLIIYIQLSENADVGITESEGDMILSLLPAGREEKAHYYCAADAFFAHQDGTWPDSIDMQPVLCADLENRLLISEPFETQEDAEAFMDTANAALADALPDTAVYVTKLAAGTLPDHLPGTAYMLASENSPVLENGVLADTALLLQNGRYLATAPDGRIAFSRRYKPEEPSLEQSIYLMSEKLWIQNVNGREFSLDVSDFYTIDKAAFSSDGRYIAILDVSIDNRVLYVYDFENESGTESLINMGEEGFGSQTAAFCWSDKGSTLYAMTGNNKMQMRSCTFLPDGSFNIQAVEEQAGAEGHIAVSQGRLFFASYTASGGVVYEIGEERTALTSGIDFCVSPDGTKLLVKEMQHSSEEEQVLTGLKLYDIVSGVETPIADNAVIKSFCFSQNGGKVYYNDENINEDDTMAGYDYALYTYDIVSGEKDLIAYCSTNDFATSMQSGQIYLIDNIDDGTDSFNATYVYDIN